jgi:hypothetical protein
MPTDRLSTLCGLYLHFASVGSCVEGMKTVGIRTTDISVVLPDGSIMSAIPTRRGSHLSEDEDNDLASDAGCPSYSARVTSFASVLAKTLSTLGIPAYDSERLDSKIRNGGILVSVRCTRLLAECVKEVFIQTGALDVLFTRGAGAPCVASYSAAKEQRYTSPSIDGWQQHAAHA